MHADPAAWPSPLTLVLPDSELKRVERAGEQGIVDLSSALVQWPDPAQRRPQQGWVWPLRLQWRGLEDWQAEGLLQGRITAAQLLRDGQAWAAALPGLHQGRLALSLELAQGGSLRLRARQLHIGLDGAQWRESLAC